MDRKPVKYFVADAFTDSAFKGNPAAVCLLEEERDEKWLQEVAAEFNLPVTCYLTPISVVSEDRQSSIPKFRLRWFSPVVEAKLCGHATLAASHALFANGLVDSSIIEFDTLSGILTAKIKKIPEIEIAHFSSIHNGKAKESFLVELDFPIVPTTECNSVDVAHLSEALNGASIIDIKSTAADDLFIVLPSGEAVKEIQPHFDEILKCPGNGIIASGAAPPDSGFDFYSRFFYPKLGVKEDQVCGSAHCALAPYWAKKLGKTEFSAYAASPRSGVLNVRLDEQNQRVLLRGNAVTLMEGSLLV